MIVLAIAPLILRYIARVYGGNRVCPSVAARIPSPKPFNGIGIKQAIDEATHQLIDKLLLERLALAAIAGVTGVSERWLQMYVNQKFDDLPKKVDVSPKKKKTDPST